MSLCFHHCLNPVTFLTVYMYEQASSVRESMSTYPHKHDYMQSTFHLNSYVEAFGIDSKKFDLPSHDNIRKSSDQLHPIDD